MSYQIENEVRRMASETVNGHPMVMHMLEEIKSLKRRIDEMESRCVCVKVNKPFDKVCAL
jgi:archaellum component FlaC